MSPADSVLQATGYKRKGGHFITTMEQTWRTNYGYSFLFPFQEKHKQELEDMRKAGHEALSIIVDEYKVGAGGSATFANPEKALLLCIDSYTQVI